MKLGITMLLRMAVVLAVSYVAFFLGINGAVNVLGAYVFLCFGIGVLALIGSYGIQPEQALEAKIAGKFLCWCEAIFGVVMLAAFIWYGHLFVALMWAFFQVAIYVCRSNMKEAQREAQLAKMKNDANHALKAWADLTQQMSAKPKPRAARVFGV